MRQIFNKLQRVLACKRGVSLMEGIISVLVLAVLMATVSMVIIVAMQQNHRSQEMAYEAQAEANALITGGGTETAAQVIFEFYDGDEVSIAIAVYTSDDGRFSIFEPYVPDVP
jgi:Tfp pilus assembly protein PilV